MKSAGSSPWCKNATKRGKKWRKMMRTQECCMGRTKWQAFSLQCFCCFYGLGTKKKRKRKVERPQSARDRRPAARLRSRRPGGQTRRLFFFCFFFFFLPMLLGGKPRQVSEAHFHVDRVTFQIAGAKTARMRLSSRRLSDTSELLFVERSTPCTFAGRSCKRCSSSNLLAVHFCLTQTYRQRGQP